MKKLYTIIAIIAMSINANAQWVNQVSGVTGDLSDVFFVNSQVGYASTTMIGENYLLKTTNGGTTWNQLGGASNQAYGIYFTSVDTGYLAKSTIVYKTTNGGTTWTGSTAAGTSLMLGICFPSPSIGYCVGANGSAQGVAFKTIDAGGTWNPISPINFTHRSVSFPSIDTGYVVGNSGDIQRTVDGGSTWTTQVSGTSTLFLNSVYFRPHSKNGWIGGGAGTTGGIILMTTNGITWANVTPVGCPTIYSVSFADANNGFAVGYSGVIYNTTDGGITWTQQLAPSTLQLYSVHYPDLNNAWTVGSNGTIKSFHTSVGITEMQNKNFTIAPNPFSSQTTISFNTEQKNTTIKITDILGKEIKTINFTGRQLVIDKAEMKEGIYFVQTTDEQKHISNTKIIIQ